MGPRPRYTNYRSVFLVGPDVEASLVSLAASHPYGVRYLSGRGSFCLRRQSLALRKLYRCSVVVLALFFAGFQFWQKKSLSAAASSLGQPNLPPTTRRLRRAIPDGRDAISDGRGVFVTRNMGSGHADFAICIERVRRCVTTRRRTATEKVPL